MAVYGARVFQLGAQTIAIYQTKKSGDRYVVDRLREEKMVNSDDNAGIAQAVRDALAGTLPLKPKTPRKR